MKLGWEDKIIFDRVCRAHYFGILTSDNGANKFHLDLKRQAGGKTIHIKLIGFDSLWLQENLMALLFRKFDDFVFD